MNGSVEYNMPGAFRLNGVLNKLAFTHAIETIIKRHEVLRTCFLSLEGDVVLVIRDDVAFNLEEADLRTQAEQTKVLEELSYQQAIKPFDLTQDCLLRVMLVTLETNEYVVLFNMHHIASDGWSMGVLLREFATLYSSFVSGESSPLAPLAVQYKDYARWQREWLQGKELEQQLNYWRTQLSDIPQIHSLPLDKVRPAQQTFNGKSHNMMVDSTLSGKLQQLCQREGVTLFMLMHSVFALLLSRYSGEQDIVVGSPIAGRAHQDVEPLIGFFVNTLVIRSKVNGGQRFSEHLQMVKQTVLSAYQYQHIPFEMLVEQLNPERSMAYNPVLQIMLSVDNYESTSISLPELELQGMPAAVEQVKFDIELSVMEVNDGLRLNWSYNQDLFMPQTIERFGLHLMQLLKEVEAEPTIMMSSLDMLSKQEREHLLQLGEMNTSKPLPDECIHQL
ncbi:condensation domain-containing protein, partial [Rheinheimera soli]